MKSSQWLAILGLTAFLAVVPAAWAQEQVPHLGYVYPAGGKQGTTLEVTLGGQYLGRASGARFSGGGIQATILELPDRLQFNEIQQLRKKATELAKGKQDAETKKQIAEIHKTVARFFAAILRRQTIPALGESVTIQVTVDAAAEPGRREVRLETPQGISNPLVFCVGGLPEFCEPEPEPVGMLRAFGEKVSAQPKAEPTVTLPVVINGQIVPHEPEMMSFRDDRFTPGDVHRYHFAAHQGERLVITAAARQLIPYLADAVPGWFQATLALYDAQGKEVAYDNRYYFHPDPVVLYTVPQDGQYAVEIEDALYRGRPDFVYRLSLGELPFITSIFPLGGRAGEQTVVQLHGWNLPVERLTIDARQKAPGFYPLSVGAGEMLSNTVPFAVDTLPECLEQEPNDSPQTAQAVTLPVIINGRIDRPGDWDAFRFEGRAGQPIVAEVMARRLDSPLDSVLVLTNAAGKRLAFNDDHEDKGDGLSTHHADSYLECTLPADGAYYLRLGDAQHEGGPDYAYRLRLSAPRPEFALRVAPSQINAAPNKLIPITVFALRKDGFAGEIALSLKDAPRGFSLGGAVLPAGQDQVAVTMMVPWTPSAEPIALCLEGRATIAGRQVVRTAVPADDMMQAFAYKHLVPARDFQVSVVDRSREPRADRAAERGATGSAKAPGQGGALMGELTRRLSQTVTILSQQPVKIPAGGTVEVRLGIPTASYKSEIEIELSDPPDGIAVDKVSRLDKDIVMVLHDNAEKAKPGLRGNLIAHAFEKRMPATKQSKLPEARSSLGTLPPIAFEVVKP